MNCSNSKQSDFNYEICLVSQQAGRDHLSCRHLILSRPNLYNSVLLAANNKMLRTTDLNSQSDYSFKMCLNYGFSSSRSQLLLSFRHSLSGCQNLYYSILLITNNQMLRILGPYSKIFSRQILKLLV